jgi:undecaprenyl-diphosphatase
MRKLISAWDSALTARLRIAERPGRLKNLAAVLAHSGDSWFWLFGLFLIWWLGSVSWRSRALSLAVAVVLTAVLVLAMKFTIRRRRPEGEWGGIYRSTDPHSFPSGHAARAMVLAVVAIGVGPTWLAIVLFCWAPFVSLARVAMGVHYFSDVLAGLILGAAIGLLFLLRPGF